MRLKSVKWKDVEVGTVIVLRTRRYAIKHNDNQCYILSDRKHQYMQHDSLVWPLADFHQIVVELKKYIVIEGNELYVNY